MMKENRDSARVGAGFPAENNTEANELGERQVSLMPLFIVIVLGIVLFAALWWWLGSGR